MKKATSLTPEFLKQLRTMRVAVVHPNDADGAVLVEQLQRIGCHVQSHWPAPAELPSHIDILFCAVHPASTSKPSDLTRSCEGAVIIAVINYENPTVLDEMLELGAAGVLTSPLRSNGLFASLVMAISIHNEVRGLRKRIDRLEKKISSATQISDAKSILMRTKGITDVEAYRIIRAQAMTKRTTTEEIAKAIIHADAILSC